MSNNDMRNVTISEGTLLNVDLIKVFVEALRSADSGVFDALFLSNGHQWVPSYALEDNDSDWWDSEDAEALLDDLTSALEDVAPEGCYFGTQPGDGACFGFWEMEMEES